MIKSSDHVCTGSNTSVMLRVAPAVTEGEERRRNQPTNQSTNQPTNQSINQSINQQINQPINQSINKSINQSSKPVGVTLDGVTTNTRWLPPTTCTCVIKATLPLAGNENWIDGVTNVAPEGPDTRNDPDCEKVKVKVKVKKNENENENENESVNVLL